MPRRGRSDVHAPSPAANENAPRLAHHCPKRSAKVSRETGIYGGVSKAPPMPWKPARLKPFVRSMSPSLNRKSTVGSTGLTRAISTSGEGDAIGSGARIKVGSCSAPSSPEGASGQTTRTSAEPSRPSCTSIYVRRSRAMTTIRAPTGWAKSGTRLPLRGAPAEQHIRRPIAAAKAARRAAMSIGLFTRSPRQRGREASVARRGRAPWRSGG